MAKRVTLQELRQAVAHHPRDAIACHALGWAHEERRERCEAIDWLERATSLDPSSPRFFVSLGTVLGRQQRISEAIQAYRAALLVAPGHVVAAIRLGQVLEQAGDPDAAVDAYVDAITHGPDVREGYEGLHAALLAARTPEETAALARRLAPASARRRLMPIGLAQALAQHGRYEEAVACWHAIVREAPDDPLALAGAAEALAMLGELEAADQLLSRALTRFPADDTLILLQLDLFSRVGKVDAIRARAHESAVLDVFVRMVNDREEIGWWNGTQDLRGKTVLMEARGGYGDSLHYGRVLPLLKARGAHVLVQGYPQLAALLAALPGADEFVAPFEPCRPYDYYARIKYVPFLLDWSWDWVAQSVPYVTADATAVRRWQARFDPRRLNVGIVWRSRAVEVRNRYIYRSAPLAAFERLRHVPRIALYGLQVGPGAAEATPDGSPWLTANFAEESRDFTQAAAAIAALDAVVSVDTSIAHLTGALGRPGYFLLPRSPDSRWMPDAPTHDRRCLWYPSAKLYRQERPGDWTSAMTHVVNDLTRTQVPCS